MADIAEGHSQITEDIAGQNIKPCGPKEDSDTAKYTQADAKGNTFEIFCKGGQYQGVFTPKGGKPVYVGKCKFDLGRNNIRKKVMQKATIEYTIGPDGQVVYDKSSLKLIEPPELIEKIIWKNIGPVDKPPTTGTEGPVKTGDDMLWVFDVATSKITARKTRHTGRWKLNPGGDPAQAVNWDWKVDSQTFDGEPTEMNAPDNPGALGSLLPGVRPQSHMAAAERYAYASVCPFTLMAAGQPLTLAAHRAFGAERFEAVPVAATIGVAWRFEVRLPNKEEDLLRFALLEGPRGMTIDRRSGVIHWTPTRAQAGHHRVSVVHQYRGLTAHVDDFVLTAAAPIKRRAATQRPGKQAASRPPRARPKALVGAATRPRLRPRG